ncbi:CAP domain-containing protein [Paracoccus sp. ME4]|uniref:CAP domain-containing protein n=1 Tax=Paracoccus sp. ME4 TaxID=3138066 RepID=UPI00398B05DB
MHARVLISAIPALALLALAACAPAPSEPPRAEIGVQDGTASLPRGVRRTDGHGPVVLGGGGGAVDCRQTLPQEAARALAATNAQRAAAGLSSLRHDEKLQKAAEDHACDMARRGVMEHAGTGTTGPGQRVRALGYRPSITAENIAAGSVSLIDLDGAVRQWAASPGHAANIMLPQIREFGIGRAYSADGRVAYAAAVYAAPR